MAGDEEDDEMYVVVELSGVIDAKVLDLAGKRCSILGVDTPEPVLKLGSYLFTGEYRDATGTLKKRLHMSTSFLQEKAKTAEPGREAAEPDRENSFAESQEEAIGEAAEPVQETDKTPNQENPPTEMVVDDS
ncbi:hypothetical protein MRX96_001730 [Rhipicephalus microplus]